jgi:GMP synthase (glutamine-hydrolysing)
MKKMLILQMRPEDKAADSELDAILRVGKISREQIHRIRVDQFDGPEVDLGPYCAIIAGGSPFDVTTPDRDKSDAQLRTEAFFNRLFRKVFALDFPFLGICSGNGLLGKYCGTPISGKFAEAVGSVNITVTEEGKKDPLLSGLADQFVAFVGHKEACDQVPQGAVLLASSASSPIQMFRIKNNIYATQFHPEADVAEFILRIEIYRDYGYFPPAEADRLVASIQGVETPVAKEILKRFVVKYTSGWLIQV